MNIGKITSFLKKRSLLTGVVSGIVISLSLIGFIAFNTTQTSAATRNTCSGGAASRPQLRIGDRGNCVSLAQELLAQQGYFKAGVTGYFGPVTRDAVLRLQADRGLNQLGYIGPKTWRALDGTAGANSTTTQTASAATSGIPAKCLRTAKTICVVKGTGSEGHLYAIKNKQVVRDFPIRTGDARGLAHTTEVGDHSVGRRYTMWYTTEGHFEMPYSLFFNGGQAIHYSQDFDLNGYGGAGASKGCVNIGNLSDAQWLFNWSPLYTSVYVTR